MGKEVYIETYMIIICFLFINDKFSSFLKYVYLSQTFSLLREECILTKDYIPLAVAAQRKHGEALVPPQIYYLILMAVSCDFVRHPST